MNKWIKRRYEAFMVRVAMRILRGRNVARSSVVTRKDNNEITVITDNLESIAKRIQDGYRNQ